jgi:hypothetical protein
MAKPQFRQRHEFRNGSYLSSWQNMATIISDNGGKKSDVTH